MADTSNGLMYGVAAVKFKPSSGEEKTLGWLDQNGMQPAGSAPTFLEVFAAQVMDGAVDSIMTNPGSDAFTMNLIKLDAQSMVDVFGGKKGTNGSYTPPTTFVSTGVLTISMHSGHSFRIFNARLSKNGWQNGINMQNVLAMGIRVDMLKPTDGKERRFRMYSPGEDPDETDTTEDAAG
ncbi:MAG: hypothetical protein LUH12_05615 [Bacteroides sp.]|nr:hypothetical protein [Bacteroides sp.]